MKKHFLLGTFLTGLLVSGIVEKTWSSDHLPSDEDLIRSLQTYKPGQKGILTWMRLQDSSVSLAPKKVWFSQDVNPGPSDSQFIYGDDTRSSYSDSGDYTHLQLSNEILGTADSVSVYANLRYSSNLFQRDVSDLLRRYPGDAKLREAAFTYTQSTYDSPLIYYLKGEEMENAYYTRFDYQYSTYRMMVFGYYYPEKSWTYHYTARQPDIVWHELGHALVDGVRPDLYSDSVQAGALHEAWGDTNALFTVLSFDEARQQVLADTRGDLHQENFVAHMAERFGQSVLNKDNGLRDLDDDVRVGDVSNEVHDLSRVLSGIVYDINVNAYKDHVYRGSLPSQSLGETSHFLRRQWVYTLTQVDSTPSFTEIGTTLLKAVSKASKNQEGYVLPWESYVTEAFKERGITLDESPDPWEWDKIGGQTWFSAHGNEGDQIKKNEERAQSFEKRLEKDFEKLFKEGS